jgi:tetratricopeptide (TPR) repeat protein
MVDKSSILSKTRSLTPADDLRHQLDQLEIQVSQLGLGMGKDALVIPGLVTQAAGLLTVLQAEGQSLQDEQGRLESVQAQLRRKASLFLREIGGSAALDSARQAAQPSAEQWWWFLDQYLAAQRQARLRRWAKWAVIAGLVLLLLVILYNRFLAPDPQTVQLLNYQHSAESLASSGDLPGALLEVERALQLTPGNADFLTFKGVLQQALGQATAAEQTFRAAEAAAGSREKFLLTRCQFFLSLNDFASALADANAVIAENQQSAFGYLLLGQVNEGLGDIPAAISAYQQASKIAGESGDPQLEALAKIQLGMLLQRPPLQLTPTPAPSLGGEP